jgi:hypothetical protein
MADSKTNRGKADRARVSASEAYEVRYFAKKNNISPEETKELIKKYHGSRSKMTAAVKAAKKGKTKKTKKTAKAKKKKTAAKKGK